MRAAGTRFPIAVLVFSGVIALWSARTEHDSVVAQGRPSMTVTRMYPDHEGLARAEESEVRMSETIKVEGLSFQSITPPRVSDWHTAPRRQYAITISGRAEAELPGGKKVTFEPGRVVLIEDVTGTGHISRILGTENFVVAFVHVAD